jgi:hypothetical protein
MTKRLFTFGCSFTQYRWPTWADIMSQEFDRFENWGRIGAGNHFILYSLIEAIQRRNIGPNDTVAIMFSTVCREDRWLGGQWHTPGSVYNRDHNDEYIQKFTDPTGFYLINVTVVDSIVKLLQHAGCKYHLMSMVPFNLTDELNLRKIFKLKKDTATQVNELYKSSLCQIKPSILEVIFNGDWNSRPNVVVGSDRLIYVNHFKKRYNECAGRDWPSFENFITDNIHNTADNILKEIDIEFDFFTWREKVNQRQDQHAVPLEHLEYLEKIGFESTERQRSFAQYWNQRVLFEDSIGWENQTVERF